MEIGIRHDRHRPPSRSQPRIGTLSLAAIAEPHPGHRDLGRITLWPLGRRQMQTFKKLPTAAPTANSAATTIK
jgi:hypothetical protein